VEHLAIQSLRENAQIADHQRLEQQPQQLQIPQQPLRTAPQGGHRQGGIAEVAAWGLPQCRLGAKVRPPGRLRLHHHQPLQSLQIVGGGAGIQRSIGPTGIGRQGGHAHLRGHIAGQGPQQRRQPLGIPAALIEPLHVHLAHLLQVVAGRAQHPAQGALQLGRPPTPADQLRQIGHPQAWISAPRRLPAKQGRQGHTTRANSGFPQRHRPQAHKGEPPCTGVARGLIRRHSRAREQELAGLRRRIHGPAHLIPQVRLHLPFVQQPGPLTAEHQLRIHPQRLPGRQIHIQKHRRGGQLQCRAGLAAGLRPLDHHGAGPGEAVQQLRFHHTGAIASCHPRPPRTRTPED